MFRTNATTTRGFGLALLAAVTLWAEAPRTAAAGSKQVVGRQWSGNLISLDAVNHTGFDRLLKKYVDRLGMVNYRQWKASADDMRSLAQYLDHLSQADPRRPAQRAAQLAFWINAYNAVTLHGILREYPTTSIRNHTAKVFGYNIWKDLLLQVGPEQFSLEQIEHKILRKAGEPRVHFAIVCASMSCPRLMNEAYTADRLEQQLAENTKDFFSNPRNFRSDVARGTIQVSSILKWFAADFGTDQGAQLRTIAPYLPDRAAQQLALSGRAQVSYLAYDWGLNQQPKRR